MSDLETMRTVGNISLVASGIVLILVVWLLIAGEYKRLAEPEVGGSWGNHRFPHEERAGTRRIGSGP